MLSVVLVELSARLYPYGFKFLKSAKKADRICSFLRAHHLNAPLSFRVPSLLLIGSQDSADFFSLSRFFSVKNDLIRKCVSTSKDWENDRDIVSERQHTHAQGFFQTYVYPLTYI